VSGANLGVFAAEKDGFEIQLRGAEINETDLNSGRPLALELQWHVSVAGAENLTVFVHGVDRDGQLIVQNDGDLLVGLLPFSKIAQGQGVHEIRYFPADPAVVAFHIGLYDRFSGERVPFTSTINGEVSNKIVIPLPN
ncbi:MAG: hypothetical protein AAF902_14985, partial [Chloroflexota bacterium]